MPPQDQRQQVRVRFPAQVSFAGESFEIREFTANLSEGGVFLPCEQMVEPGTRGSLTFRVSHWEDPFTLQAEVVWTSPEESEERPQGLGIRFVDLQETDRRRLRRLVEGIQDGSVVEAIRRCVREERKSLHQVLRKRPTDHKVIFATCAQREEIDALVHDGNPSVILRLLENPRMGSDKVKLVLRDPRMPIKVVVAIRRIARFMADEEVRSLFCRHPNAPLQDVLNFLPRLTRNSLMILANHGNVRPQIRMKARSLARARAQTVRG
jgi:uncharacterized protein (TIGR02266 family)